MKKIISLYRDFGGIIGITKTIIFNFRYFPLKTAIRFPVWTSSKTRFSFMKKGNIVFEGTPKIGCLRIGVHSDDFCHKNSNVLYIAGRLSVNGQSQVTISKGSFLGIGRDSLLEFKGFAIIGSDCRIVCHYHIEIGDENIIQDRCTLMDHETFEIVDGNNNCINPPKEIRFGKNIWIQPNCVIREGIWLPENTIISAGTVLNDYKLEKLVMDQSNEMKSYPPICTPIHGVKTWIINFKSY